MIGFEFAELINTHNYYVLFFGTEPKASTGLISMSMAACLVLEVSSFNRNMPGILAVLPYYSHNQSMPFSDIHSTFD